MSDPAPMIPAALLEFLAANAGRRIEFDRNDHPEMEVVSLEFFRPADLPLTTFEIDTYEYHLNHKEPGEDPGLRYPLEGIDLIRSCNAYDPVGILIYFPCLGEFGSWDCDHHIILTFPNAEWSQIEQALAAHVNAQWYPELLETNLLRPWADERCSGITPHPTKY